MFPDPQAVTYSTVAKTLPKIDSNAGQSEYRLNDNGVVYNLTLGHQYKNRTRVFARLRRDSFVSDPLITANSIGASMTATLTVDFPNAGLMPVDAQALAVALKDWATSANLLKLVNGET